MVFLEKTFDLGSVREGFMDFNDETGPFRLNRMVHPF